MKSIIKEWALHLIITVGLVITIQETSLKRRISIVTNTINHHRAEAINLHIIVGTNMKNKSTCHRREMHLHVLWETMEETTATRIIMAVVVVVGTLSKTTIIINTTTSSRVAMQEEVTRVMEISNNKKTMEEATGPLFLLMKTRLINKLFLH